MKWRDWLRLNDAEQYATHPVAREYETLGDILKLSRLALLRVFARMKMPVADKKRLEQSLRLEQLRPDWSKLESGFLGSCPDNVLLLILNYSHYRHQTTSRKMAGKTSRIQPSTGRVGWMFEVYKRSFANGPQIILKNFNDIQGMNGTYCFRETTSDAVSIFESEAGGCIQRERSVREFNCMHLRLTHEYDYKWRIGFDRACRSRSQGSLREIGRSLFDRVGSERDALSHFVQI